MLTALRRGVFAGTLLVSTFEATALANGPDKYLIINGKGQGAVVITDGAGSTTVSAGNNPATNAAGSIGDFVDKKGKSHKVYHGTLNGDDDPKPGKQGWGTVVLIPRADTVVEDVATMSQSVATAVNLIAEQRLSCDGPTVTGHFDTAIAALNALKSKITGSTLPDDKKAMHNAAADELIAALNQAKALVVEALNAGYLGLPEIIAKLREMKGDVKKTLKKAQKLIDDLIECELIIETP